MKTLIAAAFLTAALGLPSLVAATSHATAADSHAAHHALTDGEIRRVDKEAKKLTIRHGPIVNLDMPAMTMVFQVQDPAVLESVKAGDKIRFSADKIGGAYIVTKIEAAK
jgi:Cu(I)/Ag(I) efflux system periplasmic protein CusF